MANPQDMNGGDGRTLIKPPSRRGFAAMDPDRVRELARLGGKSAHRRGKAHEFTSEEARVAGRKGGLASHRKREGIDEESPAPPPVN